MKTTAKEIRAAINEAGITKRLVSVRCARGSIIDVRTTPIHQPYVRAATLKAYHSKPHAWLMVRCNGEFLPMPATSKAKGAV